MKKGWLLIILAAVFIFIDGASKYWVSHHLVGISFARPFYPYGGIGVFQNVFGIDFCINYAKNTGAAWSLFSSYPHALLVVRIGIVLTLLIYTLFFNKERKRVVPYLLILSGAIGNIIDAFIYGWVVDMFHFVLWGYSFPIFNVADMLVFFGVATLLVQSLYKGNKKHAPAPKPS